MTLRLSERLKNEIGRSLEESFGSVEATLFGSRTDGTRRGGDIDIAIPGNLSREEFRAAKARFLAGLMRRGLDLPIDLVQLSDASPLLRQEIHYSGVPLHRCRSAAPAPNEQPNKQPNKQTTHG